MPSSPTTGSIAASGGTVSVCAQRKIGDAAVRVGRGQAAVELPGRALELRGRVVLVPLEPELREQPADPVRDLALLPGRARDRAELEEEVEHRRRQLRLLLLLPLLLHGRIL